MRELTIHEVADYGLMDVLAALTWVVADIPTKIEAVRESGELSRNFTVKCVFPTEDAKERVLPKLKEIGIVF